LTHIGVIDLSSFRFAPYAYLTDSNEDVPKVAFNTLLEKEVQPGLLIEEPFYAIGI